MSENDPQESDMIDIAHSDDDYLSVVLGLAGSDLVKNSGLSLAAIRKFCGGCDSFQQNGPCTLVGLEDQTRYVNRSWCGWASKDGVDGSMTDEGFKADE